MATSTIINEQATFGARATERNLDFSAWIGLLMASGLPLGLFGLANLVAGTLGVTPYFFSPFGLPGWIGATVHLAQLPLVGAALFFVARHDDTSPVRWLALLIAGLVLFPFVVAPLDSLQLAIVACALVLLTMASMARASAISPLAGWLLTPVLAWLGISATLGLALAAAWTPPFALTPAQNPPPAVG